MKGERTARILLGAAALCLLLVNAGCNNAPSTANSGHPGGPSGGTPIASVQNTGDWGASLLAGGTVGVGMFPAKFTFDVTAAPSCANDYVAFNTSLAGTPPSSPATQTGTFTSGSINGQTVTLTNPNGISLTLTVSGGSNTGLNFENSATVSVIAANLAAAIARNGAGVGVTAGPSAGVVTVTALTDGAAGNLITLAKTLNNFTWTAAKLAGGVGTANIVAFNQLYSNQGSVGGLCNQNGPSVDWAYFTGTGKAVTSVVLSGDGTKVAFVENVGTQAFLRILQWTAGEGTDAGYPVAPKLTLANGTSWASGCPTGGMSCLSSIHFSNVATDTKSAPYYDYATDTIYVGDNSGRMNKFTGVFLGTPAVAGAPWPITVHAGDILTSPVYDGNSGNIFVGDNTGRLSFIQEVGSGVGGGTPCIAPCLNTVSLQVGTTGAIVDSPIVDGTNGTVLAINGTDTANFGTILQASTGLTGAVSFKIGGSAAGSAMYSGAFDNTYYNSNKGATAGHMYVCGKDAANTDRPAIYQLSFAPSTGVLTSVGATPLVGLASTDIEACSPVTEFDNPNGAGVGIEKDWIFFSIGDNTNSVDPIPFGSACQGNGCVISIDVTGSPAWPPLDVTNTAPVPVNPVGGTSGIVVDNQSGSAQASSFYFTLGTNSTGAGPGVPSCNTTAGIGCAVKLTQSALN